MNDPQPSARWSLPTRLAFRFCFAYFGLYVLSTQMVGALSLYVLPRLETLPPLRGIVLWTASHVFHVARQLVLLSGSGDKTFDWVETFCLLIIAAVITAVWSVIDRKRQDYRHLHRWFRIFMRFALGATMVGYGADKVLPLQMAPTSLLRLVEPYGNFSPMGVLWTSVGASRGYETAVGCAELIAGALLFVPRTALLGALVCLVDTLFIFLLNMTYDVPVKLFSFHLVLMSIYLIAPDASRLTKVILLNRPAEPRPKLPTRMSPRLVGLGVAVQILFGGFLLTSNVRQAVNAWAANNTPRPPLYGIWDVVDMSIDGVVHPPLLTDQDRWRRVIVLSASSVAIERMDDTVMRFRGSVDATTLTLVQPGSKGPAGSFVLSQPSAGRLVLAGTANGRRMEMALQLHDLSRYPLVSRGFHWIQEFPVNQ